MAMLKRFDLRIALILGLAAVVMGLSLFDIQAGAEHHEHNDNHSQTQHSH